MGKGSVGLPVSGTGLVVPNPTTAVADGVAGEDEAEPLEPLRARRRAHEPHDAGGSRGVGASCAPRRGLAALLPLLLAAVAARERREARPEGAEAVVIGRCHLEEREEES